jgi:tetraacyldisaccharide 4'-kinase
MTVEDIWYSDTVWARGLRTLLWPFSQLFALVARIRNWAYDCGWLRTIPSPVPTISVGNLTVGGTGKTPLSAYFVQRLRAFGAHPAIVMRGYGDDESHVHQILTPDVPVYTSANRSVGIAAAVQDGLDAIVLDDAFQHRRAGRHADIVLVSADRWTAVGRCLPAGPFREPLAGLQRASLAIVTSKAASPDRVLQVMAALRHVAPDLPTASVRLRLDALVANSGSAGSGSGQQLPLDTLRGESVLAIAGIGDPASFFSQLEQLGASVEEQRFPDHHQYTAAEARELADLGKYHKHVVVTLKDLVKLASLWPPKGPPLWYVSQAVDVCEGQAFIDAIILNILSHR